jgi:glycosyltransferase involved in cell wall biosynthesis
MSKRVLLVSNYSPDRQWSMLRFAELLAAGLQGPDWSVEICRPPVIFGRFAGASRSRHKWLGYADKFLAFPALLRRKAREHDLVHVCDHSNAPYLAAVGDRAKVVTCHDLLAVRGALGEATHCEASRLGRQLQSGILSALRHAPWVACDSQATLTDFSRLTGRVEGRHLRRIYLGFEAGFQPVPVPELAAALARHDLTPGQYLLHVGSSQRRKNREGILQAVALLAGRWSGRLVFAGEPLTSEQRRLAERLGLSDRLVELAPVTDALLQSLYSGAQALLFPSLCEGFGWPVLEAQACGCPVITADNTSLPEVAGEGALLVDAEDSAALAEAVLALLEPARRQHLVAAGFENLRRFQTSRMLQEYSELYEQALEQR